MSSYQVAEDSNKIHPWSSPLKTRQSQFPQDLLICHMLQSPDPLDGLQDSPVYSLFLFILWNHKQDMTLQMCCCKCWTERKDQFRQPAGDIPTNAAQDAVCCLCWKGTSLALAQLGVHYDPWSFSAELVSKPVRPLPVLVHELFPLLSLSRCRT